MKNKKDFFWPLAVFSLALFLRFYRLGENPAGLFFYEAGGSYSYIYSFLAKITLNIFGPSEFAVRLPSAFFGSVSVLAIYYLAGEFGKSFFKNRVLVSYFSFFASASLAVSPWHLQFSRQVSDMNLGLFFLISALFLILKRNIFSIPSLLISLLSFWPELISVINQSIFSSEKNHSVLDVIFNYLGNFFSYFSFDFLFFRGDESSLRNGLGGEFGVMYVFSLPFLIIGFYKMFLLPVKKTMPIILWFLMSVIIASFDRFNSNAKISLPAVIPFTMITAVGFVVFFNYLRTRGKITFHFLTVFSFLILIFNFLIYWHLYYVHFHQKTGADLAFAYKKMFGFVRDNIEDYDKVVITDRYGFLTGYYLPFYLQNQLPQAKKKILFQDGLEGVKGKILRVAFPEVEVAEEKPLKTIKLLNNKTIFLIREVKKN